MTEEQVNPTGRRPSRGRKVLATVAICCAAALAVGAVLLRDRLTSSPADRELQQALRQRNNTPPAYREASSFDTGLKEPRGLAVGRDGRIYVVGDRSVKIFSDGSAQTLPLPGEAQSVAVATDGAIYVGLTDRLWVRPPSRPAVMWPSLGQKAHLTSITLSPQYVYAADAGSRVVYRMDHEGKVLGVIGAADEKRNNAGFVIPSFHFKAVAGPDGLLHVANPGAHRIETYRPGGDLEAFWGSSSDAPDGFSGCCNPCSFDVAPDGTIVTAEKGELAMVKVFAPDQRGGGRKMIGAVATPQQFKELCRMASRTDVAPDVAFDPQGRVVVVDPALKTVRIFEKK